MSYRDIEADGIRWRIWERGQGRPVVFVHGYLSSSFTWLKSLGSLNIPFRLIAVDLPGSGYSGGSKSLDYSLEGQAKTLKRFLRVINLQGAVLVGNSMGGAISMLAAREEPELISRLVLAGSVTPWTPLTSFLKILRLPVIGEIILSLANPRATAAQLLRIYGDPMKVTREAVEGWYRPLTLPGTRRAALSLIRSVRPGTYPDLAQKITQPVLVISGDKDPLTVWREGERLAKALPNARFELYKGVGHLPQEEAPEKFVESLRRFLESETPIAI